MEMGGLGDAWKWVVLVMQSMCVDKTSAGVTCLSKQSEASSWVSSFVRPHLPRKWRAQRI